MLNNKPWHIWQSVGNHLCEIQLIVELRVVYVNALNSTNRWEFLPPCLPTPKSSATIPLTCMTSVVGRVEHGYTVGRIFIYHTRTRKHHTCARYIPILTRKWHSTLRKPQYLLWIYKYIPLFLIYLSLYYFSDICHLPLLRVYYFRYYLSHQMLFLHWIHFI